MFWETIPDAATVHLLPLPLLQLPSSAKQKTHKILHQDSEIEE